MPSSTAGVAGSVWEAKWILMLCCRPAAWFTWLFHLLQWSMCFLAGALIKQLLGDWFHPRYSLAIVSPVSAVNGFFAVVMVSSLVITRIQENARDQYCGELAHHKYCPYCALCAVSNWTWILCSWETPRPPRPLGKNAGTLWSHPSWCRADDCSSQHKRRCKHIKYIYIYIFQAAEDRCCLSSCLVYQPSLCVWWFCGSKSWLSLGCHGKKHWLPVSPRKMYYLE